MGWKCPQPDDMTALMKAGSEPVMLPSVVWLTLAAPAGSAHSTPAIVHPAASSFPADSVQPRSPAAMRDPRSGYPPSPAPDRRRTGPHSAGRPHAALHRLSLRAGGPRRHLGYLAEEDVVGHWIAEACVMGPQHRSTAKAIFANWSRWALDAGHVAGSQKSLGESLRQRSLVSGKVGGAMGWFV